MSDNGAVFYTDGGKRPMGAGWGMHGYVYSIDGKVISNARNSEQPTDTGYLDKVLKVKEVKPNGEEQITKQVTAIDTTKAVTADVDKRLAEQPIKKEIFQFEQKKALPVKPVKFIDAWGRMGQEPSNNVAELKAVSYALDYAAKESLKKIKILSDSQYCVLGSIQAKRWRANGWRSGSGKPTENVELWEKVLTSIGKAAEDGREVQFVWVRGHNGEKGNEASDKCATKGVILNILDAHADEYHQETDAKKYGKVDYEFPRLLGFGTWYFKNNTADLIEREDGTFQYYVGVHDKKPEQAGKRAIDHNFGVVRLKERIDAFDKVMDAQKDLLNTSAETIIFGNIGNIFKTDVLDEFNRNGTAYVYPKDNSHNKDVVLFDKLENGGVQLTEVVDPPRIAARVFNYCELLDYVLDQYLANEEDICTTDLTDYFQVKTEDKKGKIKYSLTEPVKTNLGIVKIKANHRLKENGTKEFNLSVGFSVPSKNHLARLIGEDFKIELLTWRECDVAFRYAVVITSKDGIAIFATHSNSVICK